MLYFLFFLPSMYLCFFSYFRYIYGYTHQVISSTNPYLFITVTETNLFNVLRSNYYSNMLKIAYIINFIFQILSVVSLLLALLISISNKKLVNKLYIFIIPSIIESILLIILFNSSSPMLFIVAIISFIVSITYFIALVIKYIKIKQMQNI